MTRISTLVVLGAMVVAGAIAACGTSKEPKRSVAVVGTPCNDDGICDPGETAAMCPLDSCP